MNLSVLKQIYGKEYPSAVMHDQIRLPLQRERRFSRSFYSEQHKLGVEVSRFMDGSAAITAAELQREWPGWPDEVRLDFCQSSGWLHEQADFPDMLRFIMRHGIADDWSGIALSVASHLPRDEAFDLLVRAFRLCEPGECSNIGQAIAHTKHPHAEQTLREHLANMWSHPTLWNDDEFLNWIAFDVTTCIAHLIEAGAEPSGFTEQARRLSEHICAGNRRSCQTFLGKHYPWMK